jgi:hypothetical protein
MRENDSGDELNEYVISIYANVLIKLPCAASVY